MQTSRSAKDMRKSLAIMIKDGEIPIGEMAVPKEFEKLVFDGGELKVKTFTVERMQKASLNTAIHDPNSNSPKAKLVITTPKNLLNNQMEWDCVVGLKERLRTGIKTYRKAGESSPVVQVLTHYSHFSQTPPTRSPTASFRPNCDIREMDTLLLRSKPRKQNRGVQTGRVLRGVVLEDSIGDLSVEEDLCVGAERDVTFSLIKRGTKRGADKLGLPLHSQEETYSNAKLPQKRKRLESSGNQDLLGMVCRRFRQTTNALDLIPSKFSNFYAKKVSAALEAESSIEDVKVDLRLSAIKPPHANCLLGPVSRLATKPDMIARGWERRGIRDTIKKDKVPPNVFSYLLLMIKRYGARVDVSAGPGIYGTVHVKIASLDVLDKIFCGARSEGRSYLAKVYFDRERELNEETRPGPVCSARSSRTPRTASPAIFDVYKAHRYPALLQKAFRYHVSGAPAPGTPTTPIVRLMRLFAVPILRWVGVPELGPAGEALLAQVGAPLLDLAGESLLALVRKTHVGKAGKPLLRHCISKARLGGLTNSGGPNVCHCC
uniref:Uncharacterized protein n=1 Tax=Branchiostoma floridae TaxID=7739 RepID=C3YB68_BRAFL|eukprot:XP_002606520.1 hypothetical protein BRAFLDRAFT_91896 [Branchiostoma floridae]